jgi:hypothetical protein
MAAYHDGGQQDGQFYDSDSGGSIRVDGGEVLVLPALSLAEHRTARSEAKLMFSKFSSLGAGAGAGEEGAICCVAPDLQNRLESPPALRGGIFPRWRTSCC